MWREGNTSTIVGNAFRLGYVNGVGAEARLSLVMSKIELENSTWLLTDYGNHCIRVLNVTSRTIGHYLGNCQRRSNPPSIRPIGFSYPFGLIKDRFNENNFYLSQQNRVWRINIATFEIVAIFEDIIKEASTLYTQMVWYDNSLIVVNLNIIFRFDFSNRTDEQPETFYTFVDKIEWRNVSGTVAHERSYPQIIASITACDIDGIYIGVDLVNQMVRLIDFNAHRALTVCEKNPVNSSYYCSMNSPRSIVYHSNTSTLYVGTQREIAIKRGEARTRGDALGYA